MLLCSTPLYISGLEHGTTRGSHRSGRESTAWFRSRLWLGIITLGRWFSFQPYVSGRARTTVPRSAPADLSRITGETPAPRRPIPIKAPAALLSHWIVIYALDARPPDQFGGHCNFGLEQARNGAARLGVLRRLFKCSRVRAGNFRGHIEMNLRDRKACFQLFKRHSGGGFERFRDVMPALPQLRRKAPW